MDYQDGEGLGNELSLCLDGNHYYHRGQGLWVWNTMALNNTIFHSSQLQLRSTRREQTTNILISTIMKTMIRCPNQKLTRYVCISAFSAWPWYLQFKRAYSSLMDLDWFWFYKNAYCQIKRRDIFHHNFSQIVSLWAAHAERWPALIIRDKTLVFLLFRLFINDADISDPKFEISIKLELLL